MRWRDITGGIVTESTTVKPVKPLSPEEAAREADRKAKVSLRIRDEQRRFGEKVRNLRTKLTAAPR